MESEGLGVQIQRVLWWLHLCICAFVYAILLLPSLVTIRLFCGAGSLPTVDRRGGCVIKTSIEEDVLLAPQAIGPRGLNQLCREERTGSFTSALSPKSGKQILH